MSIFSEWREQAKRSRELYPPGTRIELLSMDDPFAPISPGTRGTVRMVDDAGQLHMNWDNGSSILSSSIRVPGGYSSLERFACSRHSEKILILIHLHSE